MKKKKEREKKGKIREWNRKMKSWNKSQRNIKQKNLFQMILAENLGKEKIKRKETK